MADTIDGMLARLDGAFTAERRLLADVSHELRNPVAVIQANVEAVLGNEQSSVEERREAATVVTRATARMSRLLDDLLASPGNARPRSPTPTSTSPTSPAQRWPSTPSLPTNGACGWICGLPPGPSSTPTGSPWNDPFPTCSPTPSASPPPPTITVGIGSSQGWSWIAVRDEGPGIPAEDRRRVFDRFHRGSHSDGSGLGLAIARQIVESHDGHLELSDSAGPGSTFVIWLPERAIAGAPERSTDPPAGDPMA